MKLALAVFRFVLWGVGVVLLLGCLQVGYWMWIGRIDPWNNQVLSVGYVAFATVMAVGALAAAWGLGRCRPWAWAAALIVCLGYTVILPPLTVIGLALLLPARTRELLEARAAAQAAATPDPILDRWARRIAIGVSIAVTWLAVYLISVVSTTLGIPRLSGLSVAGVVVCGGLASVLVHEFGHIGVASLLGFHFEQMRVGPYWIARWPDGWRCEWHPEQMFTGGHAVMIPSNTDGLRGNLALVIAGGPIASLLFGLICLLVYISSPGTFWMEYAEAAGLTGVFALIDLVYNLMPLRIGPIATDGCLLYHLAQDGAESRRMTAVYSALMSTVTPLPLRDWDPQWVRDISAPVPTGDGHNGSFLAYFYSLARGDLTSASQHMNRIMAVEPRLTLSSPGSRALILEIAYFLARHRSDAVAARKRLDAAREGAAVERYTLLRAEAAVAMAEGSYADAESTIAQGIEILRSCRRVGFVLFEEDLLRDLQAKVASPVVIGEWRTSPVSS